MSKKTIPGWVGLTPVMATVSLTGTVVLAGSTTNFLELRAPTVRDIRLANNGAVTDEQRELNLFASLCSVSVEALESLKLSDYQRLQRAYFLLVKEDDEAAELVEDLHGQLQEQMHRTNDEQKRRNRTAHILGGALRALFDDYKQLADSGDAGSWTLEDQEAGKRALEALAWYDQGYPKDAEPTLPATPSDKITVDKAALGKVLGALVGPAHFIRELQATQSPASLFPDNPINVLLREFNAFPEGI